MNRHHQQHDSHHVMILMHGIAGNHKEMGYVKDSIERHFRQHSSASSSSSSLHVHSAMCNEYQRSFDGIETCGTRLAKEINTVLRDYIVTNNINNTNNKLQSSNTQNANSHGSPSTSTSTSTSTSSSTSTIAVSILGNSLGGLYARYALKYIDWNMMMPTVPILPNTFVTTATPHLGVKNFTYWKLPDFLEPVVIRMMGQSGKDLFRTPRSHPHPKVAQPVTRTSSTNSSSSSSQILYHDIIEEMSFDSSFLLPLSKFKRRIAYANAYSTDICVATESAAFLSTTAADNNNNNNNDDNNNKSSSTLMDDTAKDNKDGSSSSLLRSSSLPSHFFVSTEEFDSEEEEADRSGFKNKETENSRRKNYSKKKKDYNYKSIRFDTLATVNQPMNENGVDTPPSHTTSWYRPVVFASASASDMANSLDSLGWSKHFIDNRQHVPSIFPDNNNTINTIPTKHQDQNVHRQRRKSAMMLSSLLSSGKTTAIRGNRRRKNFNIFYNPTTKYNNKKMWSRNNDNDDENNNSNNNSNINKEKRRYCYSSNDLKEQLCTDGWDGTTLPFGHSFLIASTRDPIHEILYKKARPFVDQVLATEIVGVMLMMS